MLNNKRTTMKTLPTNFVIERDKSNPLWKTFIKWLNEECKVHIEGGTSKYYGVVNGMLQYEYRIAEFKGASIITLEEWDNCVNGKQEEETTYKVPYIDMQKVIDVACSTWKRKLIKNFAANIMLQEDCTVSEKLKISMLKEATTEQLPLVKALFEKDLSVKVDMSMLDVRSGGGQYVGKAFWLKPSYNWEIKVEDGVHVLVPTLKN